MRFPYREIEAKWQQRWIERGVHRAPRMPDPARKWYQLEMFAYPSGDIHMGHFRNYVIGDAVARQRLMLGADLLHPFGWDAFGLPAERAAIQRGVPPAEWTRSNVGVSRATLQRTGVSFDWTREIDSSRPDYYRWTQWMFIQLFRHNLAYRKRGFVNWCPEDKTVLANEQVKEGRCERCGTEVIKKDQIQWYFKITAYADRLIDDLDLLPGWPENVKTMQREWIGRSHGAEIDFTIEETGEKLPIFTTRPDTIFGVTFMAISPESDLLQSLKLEPPYSEAVAGYQRKAFARTDIERAAATTEKDGVFTGKYAVNPFSGERVQLWVADYVLAGYGTGAVMAVPAHDTRDFAFARKYGIPIKVVIHPDANTSLNANEMADAFTDYGPMVNSGRFNGLAGEEALSKVTQFAEQQGFGRGKVNYKLKDWSISRQRYWGCPIPIIHCESCGAVPVPENQLPVLLPPVQDYLPKGRSPLADVSSYMNVACPKCGRAAQRDPDTMDTFVCSSWYYLRYLDPDNESAPFDKELARRWLPIDLYIGGITHATGHLIYFRFFHKFLQDIGWVFCPEPAARLFNHGMVQDAHGVTMSKSKGNVVSPVAVMEEHGTDIARLAMFFTAPSEKEVLWSEDSVTGVEKFALNKIWPLAGYVRGARPDLKRYFKSAELNEFEWALYIKLNQTVKRVTEDFERLQFNTSIAALMELLRDYDAARIVSNEFNDYLILKSIQLAAPLIPHMAEELWEMAGHDDSIFRSAWPVYDPEAVVGETIEIAVQINGKLRDTIRVARDADQKTVEAAALAGEKVAKFTEGKTIIKVIYVPGRILNIVVKG
ncbi:MAG TPA: leucine--tRNA ligase [candidate division Zixibacteria bacterium]|nr:leucine--tRNA ligase [candidate division Zixibacteria bacterium]MDD4918668.1 leucine--tRNA ligase [candidate division Zixibacteria bacterium]MDM7971718.1 leucine--tRNA ligase [candidate division Zixibacteria bacterium]HOD66991.1 leucine--tRNA ligase [candidate division Zixibacteria bacterium]HPM38492.1 leucine--tRNA ligase [candidate division Zixibacteria bacterium]